METYNQRKLVGKLNEAASIIAKKGRTYVGPGYVFASYVPINIVDVIEKKHHIMTVKEWLANKKNTNYMQAKVDFGEFTPRQEIESRYAAKKINDKFYGVVNVQELDTK